VRKSEAPSVVFYTQGQPTLKTGIMLHYLQSRRWPRVMNDSHSNSPRLGLFVVYQSMAADQPSVRSGEIESVFSSLHGYSNPSPLLRRPTETDEPQFTDMRRENTPRPFDRFNGVGDCFRQGRLTGLWRGLRAKAERPGAVGRK